ncbi:hypothetical protein IQ264_00715 [Phormidium sp. LEGE 05292]|nr:hypothetical protein [Phormidium sp. LEGE 05292]
MPPQIPPVALPEVIPETLPPQRFQLGESVRWFQVPNGDFGRVIGVIYTEEASCQVTGLHYLVLLDEQSPSRSLTSYDFAFEDDLQSLPNLQPGHTRGNNV